MARVVKYSQLEAGPFTKTNPRLQIHLDEDGSTDMTRSYFIFYLNLKRSNGDPYNGLVELCDADSPNDAEPLLGGGALVKQASLYTENYGLCEENKRVNKMYQSLLQYQLSRQERQSREMFSFGRVKYDANLGQYVLFVPVREVLGVGKNTDYNNAKLGRSTIKLELEDQLNMFRTLETFGLTSQPLKNLTINQDASGVITSIEGPKMDDNAHKIFFEVGNEVSYTFEDASGAIHTEAFTLTANDVAYDASSQKVTLTGFSNTEYAAVDTSNDSLVLTNPRNKSNNLFAVTTNLPLSGGTKLITLSQTYADQDDLLRAGANVKVLMYNNTQSQWKTLETTITKLTRLVTGQMNVTLEDPLSSTSTDLIGSVVLLVSDLSAETNLDYEVQKVELSCYKPLRTQPTGAMNYTTYHLEQVNTSNVSNYRKLFDIERDVVKTYVCFDGSTPSILSQVKSSNTNTMRNSWDNTQLTNRDVNIADTSSNKIYSDPLLNDIVLENVDGVKNLRDPMIDSTFMIPYEPTTDPTLNHVYQLRLDALEGTNLNLGNVYLYKEVMKQIK